MTVPTILPWQRMMRSPLHSTDPARVPRTVRLWHCRVTPETVPFFVNGNFLGSGLAPQKPDRAQAVEVPVLHYTALKAAFPHDTIMMDIEGGELDFLRHADLCGVDTFIAEMHRAIYGRDGMAEIRGLLQAAGLAIDLSASKAGVHLYRRGG